MVKTMRFAALAAWISLISAEDPIPANLDRFNYDETDLSGTHNTYGPKDWIRVRCADLDQCQGWPDDFEQGQGWELENNSCRWCPLSGNACGAHHQSPINLERSRAIVDDSNYNICIDAHWMAYHDSTCTFDELKRQNAFTIERHALKISQPMEDLGDDNWRIGCRSELGRRFGKIDFSKGFSQWWHLSHIDVHVPSEHTQEGRRYSGELQMYHFYSVTGEEAGVNNEMAAVTFLLEEYDDAEDYNMLNRIICQWRRNEDETRAACGLPSVLEEYPGCFYYTRDHHLYVNGTYPAEPRSGERNLRSVKEDLPKPRPRPVSPHDIILQNYEKMQQDDDLKPKKIVMNEVDFQPEDDFDWDSFIASQYAKDEEEKTVDKRHRNLLNYDHVGPFNNYFPLLDVRTEYYFRYSGSQTIPPCYGPFVQGSNRGYTNNWRVMKDPIRVSNRQINEMHRLLRERIAPADDSLMACKPDTAAKVDSDGTVDVARPLQSNHKAHHSTFCECLNWGSKWQEDRQWCRMHNQLQRFYDHPYNFETDGF